ncbi:MAG: efflux RND transporter periplasmic adaptor subunit [Gammaproteobacteria bacterium]|nr:efflux RND transporter periplasmic adaptor subunit [Gammaproteobacteria bacterium]
MNLLSRTLPFVLALAASAPAIAAPPPPGVIVAVAGLAELDDRVEALGTLRANESVDVTASVTETITAIHFNDGDRVPENQVLAEMTSAEEHALLEEARSTEQEARRQYQRLKALVADGNATVSNLDQRRREWETARARLAGIESRLADRLVRAPFAGVVGLRNLSIGALVSPGDLVTTLDDDSVMKLDFTVPSTFLDVLRPGLRVLATARAYGAREFEGKIEAIASRVDPVTRSVTVRALLPNPDRSLRPGMLMRVEILRNPRRAILIPEEALVPRGEQQFVLVVDEAAGSKVAEREVRIGTRVPGKVEILSGLVAGEKIITHGTLKVRPGQEVRIAAVDDGTRPLAEILKSLDAGDPKK